MNFAHRTEKTNVLPSFEFEGETVEIEVKANVFTPAFTQAIFDLQAGRDALGIARKLSEVITKWNLNWNGEPFPPSFENLSEKCDQEFIGAILEQISSVIAGKKQK